MRRKVVILNTSSDGKCVDSVQAHCHLCAFMKPDQVPGFEDMGDCYRFPKTVRKHENQWCGEFLPEKE